MCREQTSAISASRRESPLLYYFRTRCRQRQRGGVESATSPPSVHAADVRQSIHSLTRRDSVEPRALPPATEQAEPTARVSRSRERPQCVAEQMSAAWTPARPRAAGRNSQATSQNAPPARTAANMGGSRNLALGGRPLSLSSHHSLFPLEVGPS